MLAQVAVGRGFHPQPRMGWDVVGDRRTADTYLPTYQTPSEAKNGPGKAAARPPARLPGRRNLAQRNPSTIHIRRKQSEEEMDGVVRLVSSCWGGACETRGWKAMGRATTTPAARLLTLMFGAVGRRMQMGGGW